MPETQRALTDEEWNPGPNATGPRCHDRDGDFWIEGGDVWRTVPGEGEQIIDNQHGLAALCLYGQSFGFSQEDVALLRDQAALFRATTVSHKDGTPTDPEDVKAAALASAFIRLLAEPYESLASRIAALLPEPK